MNSTRLCYMNNVGRGLLEGREGDVKERPIRYAARSDAYILSYYRHLLSGRYETALSNSDFGTVSLLTDELQLCRVREANAISFCS